MNDSLKKSLANFIHGFMYAAGASLVIWIIFFVLIPKHFEPSTQTRSNTATIISSPVTVLSTQAKESDFAFHNVEEVKRNGRTFFIGSVKNNSSSQARGVSVEIDLFLKNKFVDQYSSYISGNIEPGEERYFKVSCGCKDDPPAEHDTYKISIVGGY